jgi:hypothetical protein
MWLSCAGVLPPAVQLFAVPKRDEQALCGEGGAPRRREAAVRVITITAATPRRRPGA